MILSATASQMSDVSDNDGDGDSVNCTTVLTVLTVLYHCTITIANSLPMLRMEQKRTIPWFDSKGKRFIIRHPLNQRKTGGVLRQYVRKILQCGIVPAVRGEAWVVWDEARQVYLALTFGTLCPVSKLFFKLF